MYLFCGKINVFNYTLNKTMEGRAIGRNMAGWFKKPVSRLLPTIVLKNWNHLHLLLNNKILTL